MHLIAETNGPTKYHLIKEQLANEKSKLEQGELDITVLPSNPSMACSITLLDSKIFSTWKLDLSFSLGSVRGILAWNHQPKVPLWISFYYFPI